MTNLEYLRQVVRKAEPAPWSKTTCRGSPAASTYTDGAVIFQMDPVAVCASDALLTDTRDAICLLHNIAPELIKVAEAVDIHLRVERGTYEHTRSRDDIQQDVQDALDALNAKLESERRGK